MSKAKKDAAPAAPELVRVRNTREGSVNLAYGFDLEPGVQHVSAERLSALPAGTQVAVEEMVKDGVLVFGDEPESEPAPAVEPAAKPLPTGFQPLPDDDALALLAVEGEKSHAVLSAWFDRVTDRPAVSDAILARLSKLDA